MPRGKRAAAAGGGSGWRSRIVRHGEAPADSILCHPENWRIHPTEQQAGLRQVIGHDVGWVQGVIVNLRTAAAWPPGQRGVETLLDGEARVLEALRAGDKTPVPVTYVDLTPEEERLVLATFDPLGQLAVPDAGKYAELREQLPPLTEDLGAVVAGVLDAERSRAPRQRTKGLRHDVKPCTCCDDRCTPGCGCYRGQEA